jgi:hypothetical protein
MKQKIGVFFSLSCLTNPALGGSVVDPNPKESEGFGRIRKNPKGLAGSESEFDKNFGFGSRYCYKINIMQKNQRLNT